MNLRIWNGTETLYLADGTPCTPEDVMRKWPFTRNFPTLLEMSGPLVAAIDCLPMICSMHGIDDTLSDADKLAAIKAAREAAQNPNTGTMTDEEAEQLAAALEVLL